MKAMTDVISILLAVVGVLAAGYFYYLYATAKTSKGVIDTTGAESSHFLAYAIAALVVALVAGVFYFMRHVNKEEEIHITQ